MDFHINPEQRQMVASVRDLAQSEFKATAAKWMDGSFPWENMKKLAALGVLGMSVPEEYGGLGLPILDTALILEEIAKVCYVTAMAVLGEAGVQTRVIARYAPAVLRERILPKVVSGECMLAICMTEPHAGTDVANYRTNARIVGDRVILKGTKTLISRAPEAAVFIVFTRIDNKHGREGIGCVLLEAGTKGFEVTGTYHTMGGENLYEIQFNDCELPLENLVIREDGFRKLLTAFNTQRCLNPSISLGLAEGAFDEAVHYVRERTVFGKPIADHQGRARHPLSRLPDRQSISRPIHGGRSKGVLQRNVAARHLRSCAIAWRLWLHRRGARVTPVSRCALRHHRWRHL